MAGIGDDDLAGAPRAEADDGRDEVLVDRDVELTGAFLESLGRGVAVKEVGPEGEPGARHLGDGVDAAPGDVTHDEPEVVLTDVDDAVPVSSDLDPFGPSHVGRGDLELGYDRVDVRQERSVQPHEQRT